MAPSDYSAVVAGICHCAKPTVKATYMGASGKPLLRWNTVANASQYKVYPAAPARTGTYALLGTTTATHYTDNKAGSGYTYYYKVRAISKVKEHGEFRLQCSRGRHLPLRETPP